MGLRHQAQAHRRQWHHPERRTLGQHPQVRRPLDPGGPAGVAVTGDGDVVAHGVAFAVYPIQARIRLHLEPEHAARLVPPTVGLLEPESEQTTIARVGGDAEWLAEYVAGLPCRAEVLEPEEVRAQLRVLADRLARDHA